MGLTSSERRVESVSDVNSFISSGCIMTTKSFLAETYSGNIYFLPH